MGDVRELFGDKTVHPSDDDVDRSISNELRANAATIQWLQDFIVNYEDDMAMSDMHFICTNRSLMDRVDEIVVEMEAVLPAQSHRIHVERPFVRAGIHGFNTPMRELTSEISHSNHVLWLSLSDHYAALLTEYRRRIAVYNRFCDKLARQR